VAVPPIFPRSVQGRVVPPRDLDSARVRIPSSAPDLIIHMEPALHRHCFEHCGSVARRRQPTDASLLARSEPGLWYTRERVNIMRRRGTST
jgi:hypothetical protein